MSRVTALTVACVLLVLAPGIVFATGQTQMGATQEVTLKMMTSEHPSSPINPDAAAFQELARQTGIRLDIEAVPNSDYGTKANLVLATGQMPDIMRVTQQIAQDFAASGAMEPLLAHIERSAPNIQSLIDDTADDVQYLLVNDELWYVPIWPVRKKLNAPVPMIRRDILEDLGIPMPTTIAGLYDALKAMKAAFPESYPWTSRGGTANLLLRAAYPMGVGYNIYWDRDVNGGQWVYGTVKPEFGQVLEFFRRAYSEGILDPDFAVNTAEQWHQRLGSGRSFFYWDNLTFGVNYVLSLQSQKPDAMFWPVPTMVNSLGRRNNILYNSSRDLLPEGWAMSARSTQKDAVLRLFDWSASPEGFATTNWGVEGETYTKTADLFTGRPTLLREYNDGYYDILPPIIERFRTQSDPFRAMLAEIGAGYLNFVVAWDQKPNHYFDPPTVSQWHAQLDTDPGMIVPAWDPPFTNEERDRLRTLRTNVDAILLPALDRVIIGTMTLEAFRGVQAEAIRAGALEIEEIYNDATARVAR